jgi:type II secretory pathway component PulM
MFDNLRERWERLGPRERRMFALLGVVVVAVGVLYAVFTIQEGLADLARHNEDTRAVLTTIAGRRDELLEAKSKQGEVVAMIAEEPTPLATYMDKVAGEVGVQIRARTPKPVTQKGKFHEHSTQITLFDLTLDQLARFLRGIETQSQVVVTQRMNIRRSSLTREKLDKVDLTVATYSRPKKAAQPAAPAAAPAAEQNQ